MIQKTWHLPGTLEELTKGMSHREYLTRMAWLEENLNDPERSDFYLMQIAQEVRRVLSKKPNKIKLKDFRIKFTPKVENVTSAMQKSKQVWMAALASLSRKK